MHINSDNAAYTRDLGSKLAASLFDGCVVLLCGEMGAGKTEFARGVAQGLHVQDSVQSPTYTIVNAYGQGRLPLYHFDLHRLKDYDEFQMTGADAYIYALGICVIEWPDVLRPYLDQGYIQVDIKRAGTPDAREIRISARGADHENAIREWCS